MICSRGIVCEADQNHDTFEHINGHTSTCNYKGVHSLIIIITIITIIIMSIIIIIITILRIIILIIIIVRIIIMIIIIIIISINIINVLEFKFFKAQNDGRKTVSQSVCFGKILHPRQCHPRRRLPQFSLHPLAQSHPGHGYWTHTLWLEVFLCC